MCNCSQESIHNYGPCAEDCDSLQPIAFEETSICARCDNTGWIDPIEGHDGSYVTSRPCKCDAGDRVSRLS